MNCKSVNSGMDTHLLDYSQNDLDFPYVFEGI
jgi:hypothetical protein